MSREGFELIGSRFTVAGLRCRNLFVSGIEGLV
jgi:hypothetical protein